MDVRTETPEFSENSFIYPNYTIGGVIIKHIVEHFPNTEKAITELARILKPGGLLILSTPRSLLKTLKGDHWIGYQDPTHISIKSPEEWLGLIRKAGFRAQRVISDGFRYVPYTPFSPVALQKFLFRVTGRGPGRYDSGVPSYTLR